jgi:hypothetical protein
VDSLETGAITRQMTRTRARSRAQQRGQAQFTGHGVDGSDVAVRQGMGDGDRVAGGDALGAKVARHRLRELAAAYRSPRACLRSEGPEPFVDRGDVEGGFVADGEFVVPGGDGAVALEPVDAAFHGVPLLVLLLVEGPGSAA